MKHIFTRREALAGLAAAGAGLALNPFPSSAKTDLKMILERKIPSTGERLPVVGLGSWQQFDVGTGAERNPLREVLQKMNEIGAKVIDASPMYGRAEQVIGDLTTDLKLNDRFFFATKVWTTGRQEGIDQMNASMQKMRRKKIDLMQVHNLQDWETHLKTLKEWKAAGKVRYIGITHYTDASHARLEQIVKSEDIDFVQFNYSIRSRNAEKSLLKAAKDKGVAVIINEPFEQGALFRAVKGKDLPAWAADYDIKTWAQFFLKYIVSNDAVTCVIPGTSDVKHLVDNLGAGEGRLPDEAGRKKMREWIAGV
ncbi:aldo/keto reductase [Dyadobacter fermentans]|uniref:Aldo/keto reductase n=1 Tax=Dyadobacter fermentans (strain ATCC 700827 / DSM 18053 / CIP 107007 / KCTC 52180 / NS114) TaxID=471854 RepID=C6VYA1_DYAFD|nr:aldo/keto reductase [Dyadobacter fermentans]ACT91580.1 aldo/keto reductase [Dyadobacter fermentans DSM 18053]